MSHQRTMLGAVLITLVVVSAMSLLFHGAVHWDYLVTGVVCATLVHLAIGQLLHSQSVELRRLNQLANDALAREATTRTLVHERLLDAERLASAGAVAASVCHEIKNPLAAVFGNLELVREGLGPDTDPELIEILDEGLAAARQVSIVTNDLQTLARPQLELAEAVRVVDAIEAAARLAAPYLRPRCRLTVAADEVPDVVGSLPRLIQLFLNLLINAAKASETQGVNHIAVRASACSENVTVEIEDHGVGISAELLPQLFQPFVTTREANGGTGLGLFICRAIAEGYGGQVTARQNADGGATFSVTLRQAKPA